MVEAGEPEIIKTELVLLAMGFLKPEHPEYPQNVFVCGDSANGASLVVRAMASGKQTALRVNEFLKVIIMRLFQYAVKRSNMLMRICSNMTSGAKSLTKTISLINTFLVI